MQCHPPKVATIAPSVQSTDRTFCMAQKKPVGIVVRRGALRRFDALRRKTADLPVVLSWDRGRPPSAEHPANRRRSSSGRGDRRKTPPLEWEVADFVVVDLPGGKTPGTGDDSASPTRSDARIEALATRRTSRWCSTDAAREDQRRGEVATGTTGFTRRSVNRFEDSSRTARHREPAALVSLSGWTGQGQPATGLLPSRGCGDPHYRSVCAGSTGAPTISDSPSRWMEHVSFGREPPQSRLVLMHRGGRAQRGFDNRPGRQHFVLPYQERGVAPRWPRRAAARTPALRPPGTWRTVSSTTSPTMSSPGSSARAPSEITTSKLRRRTYIVRALRQPMDAYLGGHFELDANLGGGHRRAFAGAV